MFGEIMPISGRIYTTSSPLTYSFPPRTALSGLIGAIVGFDKEDYFRHFLRKDAKIGCKILEPIKKVRIGENLINTKIAVKMHLIKNRNQIRLEFVKIQDIEYISLTRMRRFTIT